MTFLHASPVLQACLPQILLLLAGLLALTLDVVTLRDRPLAQRWLVAVSLACVGCTAAMLVLGHAPASGLLLGGMLVVTHVQQFVQIVLLVLTVATLVLALPSRFTRHVGEFVLLVLTATVGMMFLVASFDLLVIFLSLELLSLSLYLLTAFDKSSPRSAEAAFKYFLFGGISAAFLLYGFSLLYGFANSTSLLQIGASIHPAGQAMHLDPIVLVATVMVLLGLGTKIAVFPLHFWAPDVYEGAPLPAAAFIASASRVASFFVLFQILAVGFGRAAGTLTLPFAAGWLPAIALLSAASIVFGNLAALAQTSARRLLAYSAIAHAGYLLLALLAHTVAGLASMLFYLATYALATLGAFAVVQVVEQTTGSDKLANFAGLSRNSPLLAWSLLAFLLSLAGVPPFSGFFAKFYLFAAALGAGRPLALLWLVLLAMAMSAVSLYYYLQLLKQAFVTVPPEASSADSVPFAAPFSTQLLIALLAAATLVLGCNPQLLLHWIQQAL